MAKVNYEKHADALAEALQEFIFIHCGSDNGVGLQIAFKNALHELSEYRKASEGDGSVIQKSLKRILEDAYWEAVPEISVDPWAAVLESLADQAPNWEQYSSDDRSVTEDIRAWLRAEAAK